MAEQDGGPGLTIGQSLTLMFGFLVASALKKGPERAPELGLVEPLGDHGQASRREQLRPLLRVFLQRHDDDVRLLRKRADLSHEMARQGRLQIANDTLRAELLQGVGIDARARDVCCDATDRNDAERKTETVTKLRNLERVGKS